MVIKIEFTSQKIVPLRIVLKKRKPNSDEVLQKVIYFKDDGQKRKMVVKFEFTPHPHCKMFPFYKGF